MMTTGHDPFDPEQDFAVRSQADSQMLGAATDVHFVIGPQAETRIRFDKKARDARRRWVWEALDPREGDWFPAFTGSFRECVVVQYVYAHPEPLAPPAF